MDPIQIEISIVRGLKDKEGFRRFEATGSISGNRFTAKSPRYSPTDEVEAKWATSAICDIISQRIRAEIAQNRTGIIPVANQNRK